MQHLSLAQHMWRQSEFTYVRVMARCVALFETWCISVMSHLATSCRRSDTDKVTHCTQFGKWDVRHAMSHLRIWRKSHQVWHHTKVSCMGHGNTRCACVGMFSVRRECTVIFLYFFSCRFKSVVVTWSLRKLCEMDSPVLSRWRDHCLLGKILITPSWF